MAAAEETADAVAAAKPARYVQAGFMVGAAEPVSGFNLMTAVEGGLRLRDGGTWLHAAASYGTAEQQGDGDTGDGTNLQLRAGIEGRSCAPSGAFCAVAGLDAGYQRGVLTAAVHTDTSNALVAIPRVGLDLGGAHMRARVGFEVDYALVARRTNRSTGFEDSKTSSGLAGVEANIGVAYQW